MVKKTHEEPYTVMPEPKPTASEFTRIAKKCAAKQRKAGKPKLVTEVRLVRGSLRKNACKDRSGGAICGSVYEEIYRDEIGRVVKAVCYPNKHERKIGK